ncbi:sensor histidine kinase [Paenibacillus validus]|nr:sensor histidine kinase [Paenibacillus validus]MED4599837.1 sensor histidine kinase [Paenibacillus validus]MED4606557.1 sensor histidine kinase [Paenibacillus validus]
MNRYLNMRVMPFVLFALLMLSLGLLSPLLFNLSGSAPVAKDGVLDLREWRWEDGQAVRLDGMWEFYWKELRDPDQFAVKSGTSPGTSPGAGLDSSADSRAGSSADSHAGSSTDSSPSEGGERSSLTHVAVPGSWNGTVVGGRSIEGEGYATYRLRVLLPEPEQAQELALDIPTINTAYRLWINGRMTAAAGQVGTNAETSRPEFVPQLTIADRFASELDIVVQISNYDHQKGGIRQPIKLGLFQSVSREKELSAGFDTLLIGSLLIMGLYHLGLFAVRTKELSTLYFGIFCLLFSLRMMLLGEIVMTKLFPGFSWELELVLEYMTAALSLPVFILFFANLYPSESSRTVNMVFCVALLAYSGVLLALPPFLFTSALWVLQLLVVLGICYILSTVTLAFIRRREGGSLLLFSCFILAAAIINDMMYAHEWVKTTERMSAFGLLVFIFSQSLLLSMKLSRAYVNEEKLSAALTEMNSGLYEKIKERTGDLEQAYEALVLTNGELSRMVTSRSHLISNISHDLGTPLTTIQGYLEAILDGLVDTEEQRERYLRIIHSKVIGMDRLIEDLFQLSQLEARQVEFKKQPLTTERLIERLYQRYELDARNADIHYTLSIRGEAAQAGTFSTVNVDVERLHQVFGNLVANAIKFTPSGGMIQVDMIDNGAEMKVRVLDTGEGIGEDDLPYVFDRFYTSNKSRNSVTGGKGLGLSIAREIVEVHGGRIWIEHTAKGQGTIICFSLPAEKA